MGEAFLDYKKGGSSFDINGIIQDYYVYAGTSVNSGDFVEFINGVAGQATYTSTNTSLSTIQNSGYNISAVTLDDNRVFIAHSYKGTENYMLYGMVCTIDKATITVGTDTQLSSETRSGFAISAILLPTGKVLVAHTLNNDDYRLNGIVCTIEGTTITAGTDTSITTTSGSGRKISTSLLPSGYVFIAYSSGNSNPSLASIVVKISGTTITKGTQVTLNTNTYTGNTISTEVLPNGNVFVAHPHGSNHHLYGMVCTVSGTTITKGTDTQLQATTYAGKVVSIKLLSAGKIFIAHSYGNNYLLYGMICSISGTTITAGTDTAIHELNSADGRISTVLLKNGKVFVVWSYSSFHYLWATICTVSGTTITHGKITDLNGNEGSANTISAVLLPNDIVFVAHTKDPDLYRLEARLWGIDNAKDIPTNAIKITNYETQVKTATTLPCNGVASTSGIGGTSTGHKDKVSIYTVEITKPTNLVVNGDFSNGLEGWTLLGNATNGNSEYEITDNKIKFTMVNTFNGAFMDANLTSAVPTNNKFYIKVNYSYAGELMIIPMTSDGSTVISEIALTASASEISFSSIETANADVGLIRIGGKHTAGNVLTISNLSVYDLTAYYGSGNEPTQEWCDANL